MEVDAAAVRSVARALTQGPELLASPALRVDSRGSFPVLRSYYRLWSALPSIRDDVVGRGFYAVSEQGCGRFRAFPAVIADDHFVRSSFTPDERTVVATAVSVVRTPRTARALVGWGARVRRGNEAIDRSEIPVSAGDRRGAAGVSAVLRADPSGWSTSRPSSRSPRPPASRLAQGTARWGTDDSR